MPNLLKRLREEKGYTQEFMAAQLGYSSKSGYCLLENGAVKLTIEKAAKIAKILEVEPTIFFHDTVEEPSTDTNLHNATGTEG